MILSSLTVVELGNEPCGRVVGRCEVEVEREQGVVRHMKRRVASVLMKTQRAADE